MKEIKKIIDLIEKSIKEEPEILLTQGNIIKDNYDKQVNEYRNILKNSQNWLSEYQAKLIEKTSISNLKIKFTNASGYFIEIAKSQIKKISDDFIQKQTLVNSARFTTRELSEFYEKYQEAQNSLSSREYELFLEIRAEILSNFSKIKDLSDNTAFLDFCISGTNIAYKNNYSKPDIGKFYELELKNARHPVIEKIETEFISNDLELTKKDYIHIITGPNMGGKSTFLRQSALNILMAHLGYFVAARKAKIPLTDKIFSRVGASDNLFLGQSTFMVEMQEVANILNNSSKNSFLIIDEIGRGTSTYDGMSLAWAILKEIHNKIKAKTLFATHYHELVDESKNLSGVKNFSVAVSKNENGLIFLRKVIPGGAKNSFGIDVAKLAGVREDVLGEAKKMLKKLESGNSGNTQLSLGIGNDVIVQEKIITKEIIKDSKIEQEIKNLNLNNLTPIEALNILNELKGKII